MKKLALLALLVASPAYADTAQNLQVTMTFLFLGPFEPGGTSENVNVSFDWNTATDTITNAVTSGGFAFDNNATFDPMTNAITSMSWSGSAGVVQHDPEYEVYGGFTILPQPGNYPIVLYEVCFPTTTCNGGPTVGALAIVTDAPVATPEPSTPLLLGIGVLGLLYTASKGLTASTSC